MEFTSVRDFSNPRKVWAKLKREGTLVVTNNGKPTAVLLDLFDDNCDETLSTIRQARAMRLFNNLRTQAAKRGFLSAEEIEAEIQVARAEMRARGEAV
jgi:hypothetical protein